MKVDRILNLISLICQKKSQMLFETRLEELNVIEVEERESDGTIYLIDKHGDNLQ